MGQSEAVAERQFQRLAEMRRDTEAIAPDRSGFRSVTARTESVAEAQGLCKAQPEQEGARERFLRIGKHEWHIRETGSGPNVLLIHGTAASSDSWKAFSACLEQRCRLLSLDLPGHGRTRSPRALRLTLPAMCGAIEELLADLAFDPQLVVGHSAGAAILVRMCLDRVIDPAAVIGFNGALLPLRGVPGFVFSPVAKLLASTSAPARLLARYASLPQVVEHLIAGTGSKLTDDGLSTYLRLFRDPQHVAGALNMMANWRLDELPARLHELRMPLFLVAAANDATVSPEQAARVQAICPQARVIPVPELGHLAHEERPRTAAAILLRVARNTGVFNASKGSPVGLVHE